MGCCVFEDKRLMLIETLDMWLVCGLGSSGPRSEKKSKVGFSCKYFVLCVFDII
jgi:hypothetical protein